MNKEFVVLIIRTISLGSVEECIEEFHPKIALLIMSVSFLMKIHKTMIPFVAVKKLKVILIMISL